MNGKVIIVTGASSGIGLAVAKEFASLGNKVVLAARNIDKLDSIVKELNNIGHDTIAVKTDVTKIQDCKKLIDTTISKYGRIDILVNNAGISMRALFVNVEVDVLHKLMDVNFWGTVYCTKFALPYLLESKGAIVGVSSVAGIQGLPGRTGYSASKFAMNGFLDTLRVENLKTGLHVMTLTAGFTQSEIRKRALTENGNEQGETPRNEEKHMTAEQVAKALIKALKRKKRHKILTVEGKLLAVLNRILPGMCDKGDYNSLAKEPNSPFK